MTDLQTFIHITPKNPRANFKLDRGFLLESALYKI
jgi:hypothetical protein